MFDTQIFGKSFFSINTPIIAGNSGGPIINSNFELVGIASKGYYGDGEIKLKTSDDNLESDHLKKSQIQGIHVTIMGHNLCAHFKNINNLLKDLENKEADKIAVAMTQT